MTKTDAKTPAKTPAETKPEEPRKHPPKPPRNPFTAKPKYDGKRERNDDHFRDVRHK